MTEGFAEQEAFHAEVFSSDRLVPVASADFARVHKIHDLELLGTAPCILRESGSGTRAVVERAFARHELTPHTLMSLGSTEAIKRVAASGLGYAVLSKLAVAQELSDGRLVQLDIPELTFERPLHLVRLKERSIPAAVNAFMSLLKSGPARNI